MNLEALLHNILTSGIKFSDPDTIRRIKILNIFQLIFIMATPLLGLFYFYIGANILFHSSIIAGLLMIPGVAILRKKKNTVLVGNYAIFVTWCTLSIIAWHTGSITYEGVISPSWILNGALILLAIFLNGYMSGTIWTIIVFFQTGIVIYLFRNGYQFINLIPPEITETYSMGTYMVALLAILLFAFLFEREKTDALNREQEKSFALRESKQYLDEIFDRSPLASFIIDRSHRVIQWNHACQELTGIPAEEILGKDVWEGFMSDGRGSIADIIIDDPDLITRYYGDSIISHSDTGWFELDIFFPKLKRGERAIVTASPILDNNGVVRGAIQTIQELAKLRSEENVMANFLDESFPKPVFKIDSKGKISFWNNACETYFGYSSSQMVGKSPFPLVADSYKPLFKKTIISVLQGQSFTKREWRYTTSDRKPFYAMARAFPIQAEDGEGKECVIINTDITGLRVKLKKLKLYAAECKENLKTISEEYDLLKKNIATFIRKKDDKQ